MIQLRPHQARIVDSMTTNPKGQVIVPTGGGKTLCMIKDAERVFNSGNKWGFILKKADRKTIVVVSPRILLAQATPVVPDPIQLSNTTSYSFV